MRAISLYSHFVDNGFLKKQIVQGQGAVIRVQHLLRSDGHSHLSVQHSTISISRYSFLAEGIWFQKTQTCAFESVYVFTAEL